MALTDKLTAIAQAIRDKTGSPDTFTLDQMPEAISNISTGSFASGPLNVACNGTYYAADSGWDGYDVVNVKVPESGGDTTFLRDMLQGTLTEIKESDIPADVTTLAQSAFEYQRQLRTVALPDHITTLQNYSFGSCGSLESFKLPRGLTTLNGVVFSGQGAPIRSLTFYENVPTCDSQFIDNSWLNNSNFNIYVPGKSYDAYMSAPVWSTTLLQAHLKPNSPYAPPVADMVLALDQGSKSFTTQLVAFGERVDVSIRSSDSGVVTGSVVPQSGGAYLVELTPHSVSAATVMTFAAIDMDSGEAWEREFTVKVVETIVAGTYTVEVPTDVTYGFVLNDAGYYESTNKGVDNSYAYCIVHIDNPSGQTVFIDCINFAESNYDFGMISQLNEEFTKSANLSNLDDAIMLKSFKGLASPNVQSVPLGTPTDGFITIKFYKDSSTGKDNDSLQFKLRFE